MLRWMQTAPAPPSPVATDWPTLDTLVLRYMRCALDRTAGNKSQASRLLGIDRRTLNRLLAREAGERRGVRRVGPPAGEIGG
jgi:DNA-binding NtrC family response regulator